MKACSTLVAFFALVSKNGMPISSANVMSGDGVVLLQIIISDVQWTGKQCITCRVE
jgi:hypothetical protein